MADIIGGLVTSGLNWLNNQEAFRQQKELQRNAQDFNKMMFNAANMYNSPLQQMARFNAAGLNPNLMYSQMANTASAPSMGSASSPSPAQGAPMSALETAQIGLLDAQEDLARSEAEKNRQDVVESGSRVLVNDATIEKYGHENNWTDQQIEESKAQVKKIEAEIPNIKLNNRKMQAEIKFLKSQRNLTDWQAVNAAVDALWSNAKNAAIIDNLCAQTGLANAQAKEIVTLMYAKLANIKESTKLMTAQRNCQDSLRRLYDSQKTGQDISNQQAGERFDKEMKQLDNIITQSNVQADLYEDWPLLMKTMQVFGPILNATIPLIGAGIIRGGLKGSNLGSSPSYGWNSSWNIGVSE